MKRFLNIMVHCFFFPGYSTRANKMYMAYSTNLRLMTVPHLHNEHYTFITELVRLLTIEVFGVKKLMTEQEGEDISDV